MKKKNALMKLCVVAGFFILGCQKDNPVSVIPGTIVPPITTLSPTKKFVQGQNTWIANTGSSHLTLFESYQKWISYKKSQGNAYIYYQSFGSWTGYGIAFQVLVCNDSIARIIMTQTYMNSGTGVVDTIAHRELPTDSASYYSILNIDNMYKFAQDSVLTKDPATNTIYLELFENGLLKLCKYYPHNCMDDCLFGVGIDSLVFGEIRDKLLGG
jgi:hypothetical protein